MFYKCFFLLTFYFTLAKEVSVHLKKFQVSYTEFQAHLSLDNVTPLILYMFPSGFLKHLLRRKMACLN
jgi:hypothetical protein